MPHIFCIHLPCTPKCTYRFVNVRLNALNLLWRHLHVCNSSANPQIHKEPANTNVRPSSSSGVKEHINHTFYYHFRQKCSAPLILIMCFDWEAVVDHAAAKFWHWHHHRSPVVPRRYGCLQTFPRTMISSIQVWNLAVFTWYICTTKSWHFSDRRVCTNLIIVHNRSLDQIPRICSKFEFNVKWTETENGNYSFWKNEVIYTSDHLLISKFLLVHKAKIQTAL